MTKIYHFYILKVTEERSRSGVGSEDGSESINQRYGSADPDPDPHQNVTDTQHCFHKKRCDFLFQNSCPVWRVLPAQQQVRGSARSRRAARTSSTPTRDIWRNLKTLASVPRVTIK
jgi:hypothetical protein